MEKEMIERALLCALFLDKVAILEVISLLRPEMFSVSDYGFVYETFTAIYRRGEQPDMMLVEIEMKKSDAERCERMGGLSCLLDGMEEVRLAYNAIGYADEIRRCYMLSCLHNVFAKKALEALQFGSDYRALMEECEQDLLRLREGNSESEALVPLCEVAEQTVLNHTDRMKHRDDPVRILTGIDGIDGLTGGLYRREVMVLGGLSSDGKTALSSFMAMNMACKGKHVLHFSFEMTAEQTMARFFSGYAGVESERLRIGGLRESDIGKMKKYVSELENLPYYFTNLSSISLEALRAEIMLLVRKGKCDAVVIDYLHTLVKAPGKNETLEAVIRAAITALKRIAVEANCAMLVVSQLNREVLKRAESGYVPQMSDLRDSGAIEYVADSVVIINRPERFSKGKDMHGRDVSRLLKLYVLKNRNGATGIAEVYRNDSFTYFTNLCGELHFEN